MGTAWLSQWGKESTDDAAIEAHVIKICPKVSGYITILHVDDNQSVKKGQIIAEIDPRDYQLRVQAAQANLASAKVSLENAKTNAKRQLAIGKAAGTQKEIDNALTVEATAKATVDSAKAQLALAEKDLADTKIFAPQDGVVTLRKAEVGAYVSIGEQLMMLVGTERWVVANFKETQLTDMRPGQEAYIEVDAYPALELKGYVDSIQRGTGARFSVFPPENATGNFVKIVQRVPVKIVFKEQLPQDVVLGPGLSVTATVHTSKKAKS
ncbi:HlyD family secretion protein [Candidatus Odyssella thessalonicensis]|uniref:HlyD family secretion protein n=1 Tax=Candidatus Odyssella thessalonicensis TaxID=84647 RepID=UPI000225B217|nr:HlyD family secretion protein [Candidatus Odyssella thessalonicensis]